MWHALTTVNQLILNCKIKQSILDGNFRHETIYKVTKIGTFYFVAKTIEQNSLPLPEDNQLIIPYRTNGIPHLGFEIFIE